ncbi:F-box protein [Panicum miliaceum]|uniref:F-box protein n=1 Tax=Panicum miliaceum TaxID=4540 RepID=A0A3L6SGT2_PANMI|nr:F-box protein [Panicum miliaceum]
MDEDDAKLSAAANLPDDLVLEILWRLPVRPLRRCKCVCRAWRDLISHPDHCRRLAQTVSGFFYHLHVDASCPPIVPYWRFTAFARLAASGRRRSRLPFLPSTNYATTDTELLDSCNGLLLLRCCRASSSSSSSLSLQPQPAPSPYAVCNPATGKWVEVPEPIHAKGTFGLISSNYRQTRLAALAFDPAVSSTRFHVLQLVERDYFSFPLLSKFPFVVEAVEIYSSETKSWVVCDCSEWRLGFQVTCTGQQATYHDGSLHFAVDDGAVMSVDTKGEACRVTRVVPVIQGSAGAGFIGRSQGRLL